MVETKSEAFHRLANKRIEEVEDKIRIFSNLSGPNYEWTQEEVMSYLGRIAEAGEIAMARFAENKKRWVIDPSGSEPEAEPLGKIESELNETELVDDYGDVTEEGIAFLRERAKPYLESIGETWSIARSKDHSAKTVNEEAANEMIAMQRKVIANLQAKLDELRGTKPNE